MGFILKYTICDYWF